MGEKRKNMAAEIGKVLYPPMLYLLVSFMVQELFMIGFGFIVGLEAGVSGTMDMSELAVYSASLAIQERLMELYYQNAMAVTLASAFVSIPLFGILYYKDWAKQEKKEPAIRSKYAWMLLVVLGISSCISLNDWISLSGLMNVFPGYEEIAQILYGGGFLLEILAIGIAAPVVEELIFRGLVYKRLRGIVSPAIALSVSAAFFGFYHMNVVQGLYAFLIGLFLAYVYERYKTIWAPIIFHVSANLVSVLATEFFDSVSMTGAAQIWAEILIATALMLVSFYGMLNFFGKRSE